MDFVITARCLNNHTQDIVVDGLLGYEWVKEMADLLDGSSKLYRHPPIGTNSIIGKCGICKAEVMCRVSATIPGEMEKLLKEKETKG